MPAASMPYPWQVGLVSTTARQFARAVGLALAMVAAGCLIYFVETCLLGCERRVVENPSATMMRAVGLAHFWIGWLFLFTSPRLRTPRSFLRLLALTAVGAGLCLLCAWSGAARSPITFLLFYGYFLVHEVLDEARLFRAYGDGPEPGPAADRLLTALTRSAALCLLTALTLGYVLHGLHRGKLPAGAALTLAVGGAGLALAGAWAVRRAMRLCAEVHGGLGAALQAHRPLVVVYGGICLILVLGAVGGSGAFNFIILIHAGAWFWFVYAQLARRPAPAGRNLWAWLRGTPAGFAVLHGGVIILLLGLMALRVHVWERSGLLSEMLSANSFSYWSVMHITMALWRPAR
jgi:hypothetical protein